MDCMNETNYRDLITKNYRLQGLSEKIRKTQRTVLTIRSRAGVRSRKGAWLGLNCRLLIYLGVFHKRDKTQEYW